MCFFNSNRFIFLKIFLCTNDSKTVNKNFTYIWKIFKFPKRLDSSLGLKGREMGKTTIVRCSRLRRRISSVFWTRLLGQE